MRKFLILLSALLFVSCASVKVPEYVVEYDSNQMEKFEVDDKENSATGIESSSSTVKIIQISDFHSNDFGKNEEKLISKIRDAEPDVIFITGDLFEYRFEEKGIENVKKLLAGIQDLCPFYFVSGNHEYYYGYENDCSYLIEDFGGTILSNNVASLNLNGIDFVIAGMEDPIFFVSPEERKRDAKNDAAFLSKLKEVSKVAAETPGDFYILLAHRPEYINEYKADGVYDLILSGHAHGGQWRLPPLINGLYAPGQGLFPKYAGGRYDFNDEKKSSTFIVSRGLSHQEPFFPRFFNSLELVEIIVQPADLVETE